MTRGESRSHTFSVRNTGTAPLEITRVHAACGCTVVEHDRVIPPGGEGKIVAAVDSLTLAGGAGNTHMNVHTNDPAGPQRFDLAYKVVEKLFAVPGYARWKSTQGEREGTIGNTIWAADGKDFSVLAVETPFPALRAAFRPATEAERKPETAGSQWRLELTLASMAPAGPITGHVLVRTDHPEQKQMVLPISGFMRPTVFLFPEVGDFGNLPTERLPIRGTFKFQNFATERITPVRVEIDLPGAVASAEPVEAGREYKVTVVLPADMPKGPFAGTLTVHTDSGKAPRAAVPLKGVIVEPTPQ